MANLTEHVIINKLNKDINAAILAVGGDTTNADGLPHYAQVIRDQLISKNAAGVISFKGVFDSLEEVDNPTKGDFVIVGEIEYVYFDKWIELGNATAAMSAIQNLRNQCVLKTDNGVDITTTSSGLQYSFKNDQMIIGIPDPQSSNGFDHVRTLKYDGGNFTIGTHGVLNNNSSQLGKYYLYFYNSNGLEIGTSYFSGFYPGLRYNDNGLFARHGNADLALRNNQFILSLGSSLYDFNDGYFKITGNVNGSDYEISQEGGQLRIGTEQQFNYQNTGESRFTMLDRDGIKFGKIGTKVGSIGNDRYIEYTPVQIGNKALTFTTVDESGTYTRVHGMDADGLMCGLTFKYKDQNNIIQTSEYKASRLTTNCFDITKGIYYASTCHTADIANTARQVQNDLIIHTPNGDVRYNGSQSTEVSVGSSNDGPSIGGGMVEVTYGALKSLRDNAELVPGTKYKITDYETIISGQNVANNKFDIIVTALSNNTLSESASVAINENDLLFEASRNIFSWSDINNWDNVNTSNIPQEIVNLSPKAVAKQQGTRAVNGGEVVRVSIVGYTGDYQNPAVQEDVKGLGASLYTKSDNTLIASDYGYDKDVYYLRVPESIAANTDMIIQFYIDSDADVASAGICGATADAGRLLPHPSISYFSDSNLSAWEIKYSLDNDSGRYLWANPNGKGVIYYMKDEYGNEALYDFKNIKYGDYYTFDYLVNGVHYDGSVKYGRYCHHNKIDLDINGYGDKGLPNVCFKNTTNNAECSHNIISEDCWDITFGSGCHHNEISNGCESLTFGNNCSYNILENHCSRNSFGSQCSYNTFGHDSCDNTFGDYVTQCSFGCRCSSCKFTYSDNTTASYVKSFHLPEDCNALNIQQTTQNSNSNSNSYLQYYKVLNPTSNNIITLTPVKFKGELLYSCNRQYYTLLDGENQIINNIIPETVNVINGIEWNYGNNTLTLNALEKYSLGSADLDLIHSENNLDTGDKTVSKIEINGPFNSITEQAFEQYTNLNSLYLNTDDETELLLTKNAFLNCTMDELYIDGDVYRIGTGFIPTSLKTVTFGDKVTEIEPHILADGRYITSITIPDGVTSIGDNSFAYCSKLASITIPNSVTSIGYRAFWYCTGLTSITIPNSVTSIGYRAFEYCTGLTSVTIGNSVTSIKDGVFECTGLTSITIPNSVTSIGENTFYHCTRLTSVTCKAVTPPRITTSTFRDTTIQILYVPSESVELYKASDWNTYCTSNIQPISE